MNLATEEYHALFTSQGQAHVFAYWEELSGEERDVLLADCAQVDFTWLDTRLNDLQAEKSASSPSTPEPAPVLRLPQTAVEEATFATARAVGEAALRAGRVAAFLVAGGQGTRLGFSGPKGCYPLGPISGKTLFQWHAEQIRARAERYRCTIPWYILTSQTNHAETLQYFAENDYLGLSPAEVMFFPQAMVPSVTLEGKLILAAKNRLAMNPDGHGGALSALVNSGAIADMQKRGVDTISYFQVDNPLVTICDPLFIGVHLQAGAGMSSKILEKAGPEEKVGNLCLVNGDTTVIEYSDMRNEDATARGENGRLKFWAGSIAIHLLAVDFIAQGEGCSLPWHIAKKSIPFYKNNQVIETAKPNGVKFETFVFDALPMTEASVTLEVDRASEFAPVKNASGVDSANSCRQLLANYFAGWLDAAGHTVPRDKAGNATIPLEISPRYALDAADLAKKLPADFTLGERVLLGGE